MNYTDTADGMSHADGRYVLPPCGVAARMQSLRSIDRTASSDLALCRLIPALAITPPGTAVPFK